MAGFTPDRFDPANAVRLIAPATVNGRRVGVHPVTGQVYPAPAIGAFAPGVGNDANGLVWTAQDPSYPRALIESRGIHYAPRVGFALVRSGKVPRPFAAASACFTTG